MKMDELVSVIVPVYNIEKYLQKCIDSILLQSYQTFELILVDDGSSDGSSELCDKCAEKDSRIKVIHKKNAGVSAARNDGIDLAKGSYLSFIDGDDWVETDYLKKLVQAIVDNGADEAAVGFKYVYEKGGSKILSICDFVEVLSNIEASCQAMDPTRPWVGFACGKLIKSSVIKNYKVKYDTKITICEDSLFNYTALQYVSKVVKIPETLYNYRIHGNSATSITPANYKKLLSKIDAFEKSAVLAEKNNWTVFKKRINNTLFDAIISYLSAMFSAREYDVDVISKMTSKLKSVRPLVDFKKLSKGIKVRYMLFKLNPRLLYFIETKRK